MLAFGLGWVVYFVQHALEKTSSILCLFSWWTFHGICGCLLGCSVKRISLRQIRLKLYRYDMSQNEPGTQKEFAVKTCQKAQCCLIFVVRSCKMYCIFITGRWDNPSHLRVLKKGNEFPLHPTVYSHLLQPQAPPKNCLCAALPGSEIFNLSRKFHCSALERDCSQASAMRRMKKHFTHALLTCILWGFHYLHASPKDVNE